MPLENFQRRGTPVWGRPSNPRGSAMERAAVSARIRNTMVCTYSVTSRTQCRCVNLIVTVVSKHVKPHTDASKLLLHARETERDGDVPIDVPRKSNLSQPGGKGGKSVAICVLAHNRFDTRFCISFETIYFLPGTSRRCLANNIRR